jgi:DNA-binding SARP family transcriptional activator
MQQVIFRLLGPPEIFYNDQPVKIPRRRSRALLYYMVSTHAPQPRERLLALLCGEMDEERARHAFKTMLAEVRAVLRSFDPTIDWIISDGDLLAFNPLAPTWLDTEIFEKNSVAASRSLNQAIKLYRGDFLDGFFLKDSPDFDSWVQSTRDHYRHLYLSALRQIAEASEANHQLEQAITCTHLLLSADPLSEEAHARLMRLYWLTGDRTEALRQYERLRDLLAKELSVKPSPSTQALYEQIARSSKWPAASQSFSPAPPLLEQGQPASPASSAFQLRRPAPSPASSSVPPFVGRTTELKWLRDHLLGKANNTPLVLIQGEAGIGKTRLINEALRGSCSSWLILSGSCQEVERLHAYHPIIEALRNALTREHLAQLDLPRSWLAQIALLLPDLAYLEAPEPEPAAFQPTLLADALVALFNQLAHPRRPLLLFIDDLHWADKSTLALLGHLLRFVRRGEVFLLGAYQSGTAEKRLASLRQGAQRSQSLAELALGPLSPQDVHELAVAFHPRPKASGKLGSDGYSLGDWCYQRCEGNPFFAIQWLAAARDALAAGHDLCDIPIPERLTESIRAWLSSLSRSASSLLSAAACLGSSFHLLDAASLVRFDTATALAACDELVKLALIVETPDPTHDLYTFTHRTVREVILDTMSATRRHLLQSLIET